MKKINVLFGALLMLTINSSLFSQPQISIVSGMNTSNTQTDAISKELIKLKSISNFHLGVLVDQPLDKFLTLRTGLLYQKKGFQIDESTGLDILGVNVPFGLKARNEIKYLEVPLMLKYTISTNSGIKPYVSIGPSVGYALSGQVKTRATAILDFNVSTVNMNLSSDDYNRFEISANALAGAQIPYGGGHLFSELGYGHSLTNFISDDFVVAAGGKHYGWTFNLGYGMRF